MFHSNMSNKINNICKQHKQAKALSFILSHILIFYYIWTEKTVENGFRIK